MNLFLGFLVVMSTLYFIGGTAKHIEGFYKERYIHIRPEFLELVNLSFGGKVPIEEDAFLKMDKVSSGRHLHLYVDYVRHGKVEQSEVYDLQFYLKQRYSSFVRWPEEVELRLKELKDNKNALLDAKFETMINPDEEMIEKLR